MSETTVLPAAAGGAAREGAVRASDEELIQELGRARSRIRAEIRKRVVGQDAVIDQLLVALFSRGHCLFVGVPGLAKTLLISTLAEVLNLTFNRVQFTPDLMPSDITGTDVLEEDHTTGRRVFRFVPGPVFANVLLADEINRTPPKTQAALLQAMQEHRVTAGGRTYPLEEPFLVFATQNPIEQEGTYPLPEAQQDRFMFNIRVDYPEEEEEFRIVEQTTSGNRPKVNRVVSGADLLEMQDIVRKVPVAPYVIRYAMKFTRSTRKDKGQVPDFVKEYVTWGAGPRASQFLILAAKARAVLHGRPYVSCEDVRTVAPPVLRHRIMMNFNAEADGIKPDDVVRKLIDAIPREAEKAAG